jgi:hypothetical protein
VGAGLIVLGILVFLLILGLTGGEEDKGSSNGKQTATGRKEPEQRAKPTPAAAAPKRPAGNVRLEVDAARNVWVCVVDAKGDLRVPGVTMTTGDREGPFRSKSFRITVGNGGGDLRIDGKRRDTPERAEPLGYLVKESKTTVLSPSKRPTCE